jgi:hypothetical protein
LFLNFTISDIQNNESGSKAFEQTLGSPRQTGQRDPGRRGRRIDSALALCDTNPG